MTENQWPQTTPSASPDEYLSAGAVPSGGAASSGSTKEAVKDEAAAVAGHAAGEAKNVAQTAKAEAANVASEVKTSTRDLLHQAKADLTDQAGTQQQKAAEGIRTISSQLHTMADASDQPGVAADLIRQAAERSQSVASWLENRDPGSLLEEVKSFARQRPGTFLLAAAGAGMLAGRLGRSLQAGAPDTQQAPSTPAHLSSPAAAPAHQETVIAAGSGDRFFDEPGLPGTAGPVSTQTLPAGTAADTTLRDNVPFPGRDGGQL
ncbi:hypothetical protein [Arthrobacter sp. ES3-54]|jgi:hypothetical protein|uniref:hypothetical protein n=1 Tax=Arthrobacter sp. ES3-54 TaxID=1502991 RepID=UPI0024074718|nr:hypothetical protein [Arthrobacter sp. ES3-54]MDF9752555.1 hypothetical protein [Arthrobacter sp. ES3-54]